MVPGEEEFVAIEQRLMARRMTRSGKNDQIPFDPDRGVTVDPALHRKWSVLPMHDPIAAKVLVEFVMICHVILMGEEHEFHSPESFDIPNERQGKPRGIDENVSAGTDYQIT